jgi:hypothetical protein
MNRVGERLELPFLLNLLITKKLKEQKCDMTSSVKIIAQFIYFLLTKRNFKCKIKICLCLLWSIEAKKSFVLN